MSSPVTGRSLSSKSKENSGLLPVSNVEISASSRGAHNHDAGSGRPDTGKVQEHCELQSTPPILRQRRSACQDNRCRGRSVRPVPVLPAIRHRVRQMLNQHSDMRRYIRRTCPCCLYLCRRRHKRFDGSAAIISPRKTDARAGWVLVSLLSGGKGLQHHRSHVIHAHAVFSHQRIL